MAKTLENGLSMIETNLLNHNWSHFVILSGLTLHQFQKKLLLMVCRFRNKIVEPQLFPKNKRKNFFFYPDYLEYLQLEIEIQVSTISKSSG